VVTRDHANVVRFDSLGQAARCYRWLLKERPSLELQIWAHYDEVGWERVPQPSIEETLDRIRYRDTEDRIEAERKGLL